MNTWEIKKPLVICEADDFMDQWDRNGLNLLFYWKVKYPNFKISLFTVPNRTSEEMLKLMFRHNDWMELLVHGWNHESNFECYGWSEEKTKSLMDRIDKINEKWNNPNFKHYKPFFKAPGWTITPGHNGYPASEKDPLKEDPQAVYKGLKTKGYIVFDRHYNKSARPSRENIVCVDCQPDLVHFHTWNVPSSDINQRNGFQDIEENFGVPWDDKTEFYFVSEAWERGLFQPCKD